MSLLAAMPRTPSTAKKHVWTPMAHPECPWPYGTIIKPTTTNMAFPQTHRQMVIGLAPAPQTDAICAIDPGSDPDSGEFYLHTLSNIHDRWEVAEDTK